MNTEIATQAEAFPIVVAVNANPVIVLTDEAKYSEFYKTIEQEVDGHVPDLTTKAGRDRIASLAYKVTRTKTAIDAAGKKLNEEARAQINAVDAQRRRIRDEMDALAERARKPLTDWEQAEEQRVSSIKERILLIDDLSKNLTFADAETLRSRISSVTSIDTKDGSFGEFEVEASSKRESALVTLQTALEVVEKAESERAELERLRAEAAERERKDAEERAAREKAEAEAEAARRAEAEMVERQKAEAERKAREEAEIKRREEESAERARQQERERIEKELSEAKERAAALERQAAEDKRRAEEEAERVAKEQTAREADKKHRAMCCSEAKEALIAQGCEDELARKIVLAILANEIPRVSLKF
jgi:colicin import membrane protein